MILGMRSWDDFFSAVQQDTTLHQDLLSFVAQPWVDRPWYRANTHPAMVAVFNDRTHAAALADLRDIINTIDRSLAPEQARWFVPYLRDVSSAPVIYTAMTSLTSRVFDDDAVAALERTVDVALTPERLAKVFKAMKAAMAAPVPKAVLDATLEGGNPVVSGAFTGFQTYWTKARRSKYLGVYDEVQTDDHFCRVAQFMRELLPLSGKEGLETLFCALDGVLPQERLDRLAVALGGLLGGDWGLGVAQRLDDALPDERVTGLLLAVDEATDTARLERTRMVLEALATVLTPQRLERTFAALELVLAHGRLVGYKALIDRVTDDPVRLERFTTSAERLLTPRAVGAALDLAGVLLADAGRSEKVFSALDMAWGDASKLELWLDAVDTINIGRDGRGSKLLAIADLATTPQPGPLASGGLPNLGRALEHALSAARIEALGAAIDRVRVAVRSPP
ncbi:hypothetical protein MNEG_2382 [Monoraphidium neglectum]|uniref:Uncharacterized protein n=1 Tax=Monoraphidium neglectum TaxID=145388 RepID=A0A0D2MSS1_9CHLO|nr:hypothetical protein MNEG_2382 [Monoraphidium neglectum]KIZ05575.1 hypothetical protein MNEG_2382 [Monoraphidium neglectum]|eukprot:XP_013904594.1 hypothetical protein MNEG_2382 [Monoraphidium neglectum]